MNQVRKIAKNSLFVLTARVLEAVFNLLILTQIARYLGIDGFGAYSLVLAITWVLSPMLFLGLNQILARDVAIVRERTSDILGNALVLNLLMVLPVIVCAIPVIYIFGMDRISIIALFISVGYFIIDAFIRNFFGVIIAFEEMKYLTWITLINVLTELVLVLLVVHFDLGFLSIFLASGSAGLISLFACLLLFMEHFLLPRIRVNFKNLYDLFVTCLPLMISLFLINGFLYVDVFVLKFMGSNADVGLFQAPHKILMRMQVLPMAFFVVLLPVFSRLAQTNETLENFRKLYAKTFKMTLIFALPVAVIGFAFSDVIVLFLFGQEFSKSGLSLSILLLAFPFLCLTTLCRYLLIALKKQKLVMFSDGVCLITNFVLDIILVPRFGFIGASFGTLFALVIQSLTNYVLLSEHSRDISWLETVLAPVAAAVIFVLFLFGIGRHNHIILLPVGIVLYIGTLFISKGFSAEDMIYIKKILSYKKTLQK